MELSQIEATKEAGVKLQKALSAVLTTASSFSKHWRQCGRGTRQGF